MKIIVLLLLFTSLAHGQTSSFNPPGYDEAEVAAVIERIQDPSIKRINQKYLREWLKQTADGDSFGHSRHEYAFNAPAVAVITHVNFGMDSLESRQSLKLYDKFERLGLPKKILFWDANLYIAGPEGYEERFKNFFSLPSEKMYEDTLMQWSVPTMYVQGGKFFFGGGNFSACLCSTVLGAIVNAIRHNQDLELFFVRDAMYDLGIYYATFFGSDQPPGLINLSNFTWTDQVFTSDAGFFNMIQNHWLKNFELPCFRNSPFDQAKIEVLQNKFKRLSFLVYRDGRYLGTLGQGEQKMHLKFIELRDIDKYL